MGLQYSRFLQEILEEKRRIILKLVLNLVLLQPNSFVWDQKRN
jgi:hypothetical protein